MWKLCKAELKNNFGNILEKNFADFPNLSSSYAQCTRFFEILRRLRAN